MRRHSARSPSIELAVPRSTPNRVRGTATSITGADSAGIEAVASGAAFATTGFDSDVPGGLEASAEDEVSDASAVGSGGIVAAASVAEFAAALAGDSLPPDRGGEEDGG